MLPSSPRIRPALHSFAITLMTLKPRIRIIWKISLGKILISAECLFAFSLEKNNAAIGYLTLDKLLLQKNKHFHMIKLLLYIAIFAVSCTSNKQETTVTSVPAADTLMDSTTIKMKADTTVKMLDNLEDSINKLRTKAAGKTN